jgi:hypothetical protein
MGQEFAPAPMTANTNAPPVLGRNPNTYFNLMGFQDSLRQAEVQQNTPVDPQQQQQQQQQQPTGLASLPGTGSMQNLAGIMPQQPYNQHPNMNPYMPQPTNKGFG